MKGFSVRIKRGNDGLIVARIPSLSKAVGYGLDAEEAMRELFRCLRREPTDQVVPGLAAASTLA